MTESGDTLDDFIASSLKPVLSKRIYLQDKPCARCHRGTNIRVNKSTCSHRICATCLAEYGVISGKSESIRCPACSTYWFTLHKSCFDVDNNVIPNTDLLLRIESRRETIKSQVFKQNEEEEKHELISTYAQDFEDQQEPRRYQCLWEPTIRPSEIAEYSSADKLRADSETTSHDQGDANWEDQVSLVQEQWKKFRAGLATGVDAPESSKGPIAQNVYLQSSTPSSESSDRQKIRNEKHVVGFSFAKIATETETERLRVPTEQEGHRSDLSASTSTQQERIQAAVLPGVLLVMVCFVLELVVNIVVGSVFIPHECT